MAELFYKLGYNFDDPNDSVKDFSSNVVSHFESVPSIIEDWQSQDIADNNVGGYLTNPVANVTQSISNSANNILIILKTGSSSNIANVHNVTTDVVGTTSTITALFQNIINVSIDLILQSSNTLNGFKAHTDRISGVTNFTDYLEDNVISQKPFYSTIMAYSKVGVYIMYQTDEIANSSTVLGSMTSILVKPQLDQYDTIILTYANTINSSINVTTSGSGTEADPYTATRTSNLSLSVVTQINNDLADTNNYMNTRRTHDENFYTNLKTLINDYNTTRQFSRMGETQLDLMNNFIGTDKLKERIN
ncbi:MAG: hypothetical protein FJY17_00580 [Bacteroidetes bacterium]|nr:hypothetical protein [Bacteroidota bacterium]